MKIGILTLPRAINDGAVLQAYCLQQLLRQRQPTATVEIIDYQTWTVERKEWRKLLRRRPPFINLTSWRKRRSVQAFVQQHCQMSPTSLVSDDLSKAQKFIRRQAYDAIVVGSDVVWQVNPGRVLPPPPNIYHLPQIDTARKLSFAASADLSDQAAWEMNATAVRNALAAFDYITVRDTTTHTYLQDVVQLSQPTHFMPDPTLLWDFSDIITIPHQMKPAGQKLAGVAVSTSKIKKALTRQLEAAGYKIVNLLGTKVDGQISAPMNSLAERIGVFGILDFIVADRFHSSIFTLKLAGAPAVFLEPAVKYPQQMSKGRDLFTRLGMAEMVWSLPPDEHVPPDLVRDYLHRWTALETDLPARFARLRQQADPHLQAVDRLLS